MAYPTNANQGQYAQNAQQILNHQARARQQSAAQEMNMLGADSRSNSVLYEKFIAVNTSAHGERQYALETLASSLSDIVCYPYKREVSLLFFCVWQGREISANIVRRENFSIELSVSLLKPYRQLDKVMPYLKLSDIEFGKLTLIFADVIAQRTQDHKFRQQVYSDELKRMNLTPHPGLVNSRPQDIVTPEGYSINDPFPGKVFRAKPVEQGFWGSLFGDKK